MHLVGDVVGQRALRYYATHTTLVASPHDLTMLATGRCPFEIDIVAAASMASVEWSLDGASLVRCIRRCHPRERIAWRDGVLESARSPTVDAERIEVGDQPAIERQVEAMIELAQASGKLATDGYGTVKTDLTAGVDSRAVFGLLLSVVERARLTAQCQGVAESTDVRTASRLAGMYDVPFIHHTPEPPSIDAFIEHADLLTFAMNGDTSSKRAIAPPPTAGDSGVRRCGGRGGEIVRGHYYGVRRAPRVTPISVAEATEHLQHHSRIDSLPWRDRQLRDGVVDRLWTVIDDFSVDDGYDAFDAFYLHERWAVWGAMTARFTWHRRPWSPFVEPSLVRLAYQMPSPIGKFAAIQHSIIRRFALRAYWVRVNGALLLATDTSSPVPRHLGRADRGLRRLARKVARRPEKVSLDQSYASIISGSLASTFSDLLTDERSVATTLFGSDGVEAIFREHRTGAHNHVDTLGHLVSIERWRRMAEGISRSARARLGFG